MTAPTNGSAVAGWVGRNPGSVAPRTSGAPQYTHSLVAAGGKARWQRGQDFGTASTFAQVKRFFQCMERTADPTAPLP